MAKRRMTRKQQKAVMAKLQSVSKYHQTVSDPRYEKALKEYQNNKRRNPPRINQYYFTTLQGRPQTTGYVIRSKGAAVYGKTKKATVERALKRLT